MGHWGTFRLHELGYGEPNEGVPGADFIVFTAPPEPTIGTWNDVADIESAYIIEYDEYDTSSPAGGSGTIILDLVGDGFDLSGSVTTSLATGSLSLLHWTTVGTDDAFLALDATSIQSVGFVIRESGSTVGGQVLFRPRLD